MSIKKYFLKLRQMDALIRRKATGDQSQFSDRVNMSKSSLNYYLKEMKDLGFPIRYCRKRCSYYYDKEGKMVENLFYDKLSDTEIDKYFGGERLFDQVACSDHSHEFMPR
jgi:hypothetical protein